MKSFFGFQLHTSKSLLGFSVREVMNLYLFFNLKILRIFWWTTGSQLFSSILKTVFRKQQNFEVLKGIVANKNHWFGIWNTRGNSNQLLTFISFQHQFRSLLESFCFCWFPRKQVKRKNRCNFWWISLFFNKFCVLN